MGTAVVSQGDRPDLAGGALLAVHQPTVLIIAERGPVIIELNRTAVEIVAAASYLFEHPGPWSTWRAWPGSGFTRS